MASRGFNCRTRIQLLHLSSHGHPKINIYKRRRTNEKIKMWIKEEKSGRKQNALRTQTLLIHTLSLPFFIRAFPTLHFPLSIIFSLAVRFKFTSFFHTLSYFSCAPGYNQITATKIKCARNWLAVERIESFFYASKTLCD